VEDFKVTEVLGYEPGQQGEHLYLDVCKKNLNTDTVAKELARTAGVPARNVSYSGLKDKLAETRQWFSIHLPGKEDPDWTKIKETFFQTDKDASFVIIKQVRHDKKLRRGAHRKNNFVIRVKALKADKDDLDSRLELIQQNGVPNYFGPQRFGYKGQNLLYGEKLIKGEEKVRSRHKKSLYLSSVRSLLFNHILSARVKDQTWNRYKAGDVFMLDGSHSIFVEDGVEGGDEGAEKERSELKHRLSLQELHPTGPLWGEKGLRPELDSELFEQHYLESFHGICKALEKQGLAYQRRSLRMKVNDLDWHFINEQTMELSFNLSAGCFATAVLRELISFE